MRRLIAVAAVAGAFVFGNVGSAAAQDSNEAAEASRQGRIGGKWLLNQSASDDPAAKLRQAFSGRRRPGGGGGRPGGGRRPGGGEGGGEDGGGGGGQDGQGGEGSGRRGPGGGGFGDAVEAFRELSIDVDGALVVMVARDGTANTYKTDGSAVKTTGPGGNEIETMSEWKEAALVVKKSGGRGSVERRYEVDYRTGQLVVTTKLMLPRGGQEVEIRTIYEPLGGQDD
ncbi:MAG: hypothetical protein ABFS14_08520 [Gemmatimonadota bacterium]